jgi:hypothetical protein
MLVALTGWGQEDRRWAAGAGFGYYLVKPVKPMNPATLQASLTTLETPGPRGAL